VAIVRDKYELWRPRLNQVITGTVKKGKDSAAAGNALGFMSMTREQLRQNYEIAYLGEENLQDNAKTLTWHLQLTPKTAANYKIADLWVDGNGMPRQGRVTERNNDTTTILLQNIVTNSTIKADDFRLAYDKKKVKIVPN